MSKYGTTLLSRDDFREGVFARDHHKCVICGKPALDAHHVLERRLWPDGGYYLDNGASLCETHHLAAEMTALSCEEVRAAAGISTILLPPHLSCDECFRLIYDWGGRDAAKGRSSRSAVHAVHESGEAQDHERSVQGVREDVQEALRVPPQAGKEPPQRHEERSTDTRDGLRTGSRSSQEEGKETRVELHHGAPAIDGGVSRSASQEIRSGSSPQRDSGRQPEREPRDHRPEGKTRIAHAHQSDADAHPSSGEPAFCRGLSTCERYDKWGNPLLPSGDRLRGELYADESVKKILSQAPFQIVFRDHVKYPRTYHLPWSPGLTKDDRVMPELNMLAEAPRVIAHVKMDGENTSMYSDFIHARSLSPLGSHPSRTRVKVLHGRIAHEIPKGWRICAENLQGKHSIHYHQLKDYVYGFAIWNEENECLPWDETAEWFGLLGITPCPIIYDGPFDEKLLRNLWKPQHDGDPCEGYVLRIAGSYRYRDYRRAVGKYVRANHVQTHAHWMQQFEPNVIRQVDSE